MSAPRRHLRICMTRTTGTSTTKYERQWNLYDLLNSLDHGDQLLRLERNVDDLRWTATAEPQFSAPSNQAPVEATTGMSRTMSKNCTGSMNECTVGTCLCVATGIPRVSG